MYFINDKLQVLKQNARDIWNSGKQGITDEQINSGNILSETSRQVLKHIVKGIKTE